VTPVPPPACGAVTSVTIEGYSYPTVSIGTQCWTKENLKVTKYNDGTPIPDSTSSTWGTAKIGARTGYDVSVATLSDYVGTFGYLYNWYAANDSRKLCPIGWHVPSDIEWTSLIQFIDPTVSASGTGSLMTTAGSKLKSTVTNATAGTGLGWNPASPGTDDFGFSALPGGFRNYDGTFYQIRVTALFWSATDNDPNNALDRSLDSGSGDVSRYFDNKSVGASVRCLKD
jgi:uncharacterized protein (TIGR02145 family)